MNLGWVWRVGIFPSRLRVEVVLSASDLLG
jgi:hypothetical protein